MALDPRIPLMAQGINIEPRSNALMRAAQLQGTQDSNALRQMQMQQLRQAAEQSMMERQAAAQRQQQIDGYLQSLSGQAGPPQPFNPAEAVRRLGSVDAAQKLQGMVAPPQEDAKPMVGAPGSVFFDPKTRQPIFTVPTSEKPMSLPASVQEYEYAKKNGFRGTYQDWQKPKIGGGGGGAAAPVQPAPVKMTAAQEKAELEKQKSGRQSEQMLSAIQTARSLLGSNPTQSGIGSAVDAAGRMFGMTSDSAQTAAKLETLSGWMVANVPRMEGPQSNFDIQNYQTMAAKVGDRSVPVSERLAALSTLEELHRTYADINGTPMPAPNRPKVDTNLGVPSVTKFNDASKEQRYQEWKRSQGGKQ